jgi:hypothetical protein
LERFIGSGIGVSFDFVAWDLEQFFEGMRRAAEFFLEAAGLKV